MKSLLNLAGFLLVGYGILVICVYLFQSRLIYFPNIAGTDPASNPSRLGLSFEEVDFSSTDGVRLHGWFIPAQNSRGVLLFLHGNAGNITHRLDSIAIFNRLGLSVFIFDYRGFGQSSGRPTEQGTYDDAESAWQYLTARRGIAPTDIVIFGRSLGASIGAWLAARATPLALILESAFTSAPDVAAKYYWFLPVRALARIRYDTDAYLRQVTAPVLVIHSADDEIIPVEHGKQLFAAAGEPKSFLELWGGHNEGFLLSEPVYSEGLDEFLTRHL